MPACFSGMYALDSRFALTESFIPRGFKNCYDTKITINAVRDDRAYQINQVNDQWRMRVNQAHSREVVK